jgi:PKHD-type hydroxylase
MIWFEPPNQIINWEYKIENVLSDNELQFIEDYVTANDYKLTSAEVRSEADPVDTSYRRSDILFLDDVEVFMPLYNLIFEKVMAVNTVHFKYSINYSEVFQYALYKEEDAGCYDIHTDAQLRNTSGASRKISFSILLNDPSEFEGGKLLFHSTKDPIEAEMNKGDMMLFPSFLPHSVTPVTKGVRKSLVGWVCGPNFV